ncbi:MAG: TIGR03790 family protein [Verrucomicrobiota bacterium]
MRAEAQRSAEELRRHLLVVYNESAPDSERLAEYYALKRGIDAERVVGLRTSREEEIDRDTFNLTIWEPLNALLEERGWIERSVRVENVNGRQQPVQSANRNEIRAIVLMKGMPLKIKHDPGKTDLINVQPAAAKNGASVDSELAMLPTLGLPISGFLPNPYSLAGFARPFDAVDARKTILVARLDAPTSNDVVRMIDDAIYAEQTRLAGRGLFDIRSLAENDNYRRGDDWIEGASEIFRQMGWPVAVNRDRKLFKATSTLSGIGFYAGWYYGKPVGPMLRPPQRFRRGAIAYHLFSFSAATLRRPEQSWVPALLSHGAAASMGCVYEPYLAYTPNVEVFAAGLAAGFTLAEAAYMSQPVLSWMTVVVGDPLYRPFALPLERALALSRQKKEGDLTLWLETEALRRQLRQAPDGLKPLDLSSRLLTADADGRTWMLYAEILMEWDRQRFRQEITQALKMAGNLSVEPIDAIRSRLLLSGHFRLLGQKQKSKQVIANLRRDWPEQAEAFAYAPPPPKPKPAPKATPEAPPRAVPVQP